MEEGTVLGGLGGAVAETLGDRYPVTVKRLGILDVFGESGPDDALLEKYRLSPSKVAEDVASAARIEPGMSRNSGAGCADAQLTPATPVRRRLYTG